MTSATVSALLALLRMRPGAGGLRSGRWRRPHDLNILLLSWRSPHDMRSHWQNTASASGALAFVGRQILKYRAAVQEGNSRTHWQPASRRRSPDGLGPRPAGRGWHHSMSSLRDDLSIRPTLKNTYFSNQGRKKRGTNWHTRTAALLSALKKMFPLFTSRFVIPPPPDMITGARLPRNRFWAADWGRSPTAEETQEELEPEACEAD